MAKRTRRDAGSNGCSGAEGTGADLPVWTAGINLPSAPRVGIVTGLPQFAHGPLRPK
jgi:hypothetical protein